MGQRGPAPQPTALKLLKGNPGKRALNKLEPKPRLITDPAQLFRPDYLDDFGIQEWDRLVPLLIEMGVLTVDNYLVVAMIANIAGRLRRAQLDVNSVGQVVVGASGPMLNPLLKIVESSEAQLKPLLREVGITPSSRAGVSVVKGGDAARNPWQNLKATSNGQ